MRACSLPLIALLTSGAVLPAHAGELLINGGFESNGGAGSSLFTGWTLATEAGSGGNWYAQTGASSPLNGLPVAAPPGGSFAAMTDDAGPSSQALLQSFLLPGPGSVTLSFDYFRLDATNGGDQPLPPPPDSLDYNTLNASGQINQQARVDILTAGAAAFDLGAPVLFNALTTTPNDLTTSSCFPSDCSYQHLSTDLTAFVGSAGTYQLRIAEVDDIGPFVFGVDNMSIDFEANSSSAPEPSSILLLVGGLGALACAARKRSRR
ncbi:exported hypothetical protein [Candidatus Sulfopaludibacter sp. SbA3]|nr:exported hypothetical protein [Candidatus Sulfopaludibacter sp. SbA3]